MGVSEDMWYPYMYEEDDYGPGLHKTASCSFEGMMVLVTAARGLKVLEIGANCCSRGAGLSCLRTLKVFTESESCVLGKALCEAEAPNTVLQSFSINSSEDGDPVYVNVDALMQIASKCTSLSSIKFGVLETRSIQSFAQQKAHTNAGDPDPEYEISELIDPFSENIRHITADVMGKRTEEIEIMGDHWTRFLEVTNLAATLLLARQTKDASCASAFCCHEWQHMSFVSYGSLTSVATGMPSLCV